MCGDGRGGDHGDEIHVDLQLWCHDTSQHVTTRHNTSQHVTTRHVTTRHDTSQHDTTRMEWLDDEAIACDSANFLSSYSLTFS
jgi:hypothetical protein